MTWIDDRLAERKALEDRELRISIEASRLYGELWRQIMVQVSEAKAKGIKVLNPLPDKLVLSTKVPTGQNSSLPLEFSLNLKQDNSALVAKVTGGDITFTFDLENNDVVLKHKDKTVTIWEAAIIALDPFLFSDLKRSEVDSNMATWKKAYEL